MDCLDFFDMLDIYEKLTEEEISKLDNHAAECDICRYEYEFFKSITNTVSTLPCLEPPSDLIAKVNKQIDEMPIATGKFNGFVNNLKNNAYRYATVAACVAVGLVVGLNSKTINEALTDKNADGVISTTTIVTETESDESDVIITEPIVTETPVEEVVAEVETVKPTKHKSKNYNTTKVEKPIVAEKPTVKPAPATTPKPTVTETSVTLPATVENVQIAASETPVAEVAPTEIPEPNNGKYTIARGVYHIPETEIAMVTEAPVDVEGEMQEYSLATGESQIAIGYYEVSANSIEDKKAKEDTFTEQLIVNVKDVGTITSYMSTLGAMNSGKGYQMALADFYELLMILDEDEISYRYSSSMHVGDTIIFSIVTY